MVIPLFLNQSNFVQSLLIAIRIVSNNLSNYLSIFEYLKQSNELQLIEIFLKYEFN